MPQNAKQHWASFNSDTAKEVLVSGDIVWMDNVVLLIDAPNRANALKSMDFL
jgi:spermidine/putrescine transport system substrate-binding protein